jgi:chromosome segregation ATPase
MAASLQEQEVLANSLLEQQKGIEAVKAFQTLIASNPPNTDWLYYQLGKAYSLDKKWAKAAESFMQALKLNPQLAIAAVAFGDTSVAMKAYEEAEKAYLHALKFKSVHPELAQSYLRLGEILVNDKQYEFALHAYKNALGLDSGLRAQLVEIYKVLAETLTQENKAELAQQVAERAKAIEEELVAEKAADEIDENELLLLQLHQVQEELETYFIKNQELETKLQDTESKLQDTESKLQDTESKLQDTESKLQSEKKSNEKLQKLEQENAELAQRQQLLDEELIKAEAQIELIKDILIREKAF